MARRVLETGAWVVLAATCVLSACAGSEAGPSAAHRSGSRLRAKVLEGAWGARVHLGFTDGTLGVDCSFEPDPEGVVRCQPAERLDIAFTDPSCTQPIAVKVLDGCNTSIPRYAAWKDPGTADCGGRARTALFEVGADRIVPTHVFWKGAAGCDEKVLPSAAATFEVVPVAPERFVAAGLLRRRLGDVVVAELRIEDGASLVWNTLEDASRGWTCAPGGYSGGRACLPEALSGWIGEYADRSCSTLAFPASGTCTPVVGLVGSKTGDPELFLLGDPVQPAYGSFDMGCFPVQGDGVPRHGATGALAWSELPALSRRVVGDAFPAVEVDALADGTLLWTNPMLVADETGVPCGPSRDLEGILRCTKRAPVLPDALTVFAENTCVTPLIRAEEEGPAPTFAIRFGAMGFCGEQRLVEAVALGAEHTGPVFRDGRGTCRAFDPELEGGGRWFVKGEPLDVATLQEVRELTE